MFIELNLFAQKDSIDESSYILENPETLPRFPGPFDSLNHFFKQNLKIPKDTNCYEGRIYIEITIDTLGNVINPVIRRGLCPAYNQEAMRLISIMPKWIPGMFYDKKVNMRIIMPIFIQEGHYDK